MKLEPMDDDSNAPATKADIALILTELRAIRQDLEDFKVEINTRFQQFEHRMEQNLLDTEGKIITSNYRLADSIQ